MVQFVPSSIARFELSMHISKETNSHIHIHSNLKFCVFHVIISDEDAASFDPFFFQTIPYLFSTIRTPLVETVFFKSFQEVCFVFEDSTPIIVCLTLFLGTLPSIYLSTVDGVFGSHNSDMFCRP